MADGRRVAFDLARTAHLMADEKILIIEDDPVVMSGLRANLLKEGYQVFGATDGLEAIQFARIEKPALIILDLTLPNHDPTSPWDDGFAVLGWLRRTLSEGELPVIIHTGDCSPAVTERAKALGVATTFRKGVEVGELLKAIRAALAEKKSS